MCFVQTSIARQPDLYLYSDLDTFWQRWCSRWIRIGFVQRNARVCEQVCRKKVLIKWLHILKSLNASLKAYSYVMNWAAKANYSVHMFKVGCQPSREKVVPKLYCHYNMKEAAFLPYLQREVSNIFWCLGSLCVAAIESIMFDSPVKDLFVEPSKSVIHWCHHYRFLLLLQNLWSTSEEKGFWYDFTNNNCTWQDSGWKIW